MSDLIERQAAIDAIMSVKRTDNIKSVAMLIMDLPSAQPERLDADQIYAELLKVYGMDGLPCDVYNIIGMLMIRLRMEVDA